MPPQRSSPRPSLPMRPLDDRLCGANPCARVPSHRRRVQPTHVHGEARMAHGGDTARTLAPEPAYAGKEGVRSEAGAGFGPRLRQHVAEWRPVYLAFALSRALVLLVGFGA